MVKCEHNSNIVNQDVAILPCSWEIAQELSGVTGMLRIFKAPAARIARPTRYGTLIWQLKSANEMREHELGQKTASNACKRDWQVQGGGSHRLLPQRHNKQTLSQPATEVRTSESENGAGCINKERHHTSYEFRQMLGTREAICKSTGILINT